MIYCIIQCNPLISTFYISTFLYIDLFSNFQMVVFLFSLTSSLYLYIDISVYRHKNFFPVNVNISGLHCTYFDILFKYKQKQQKNYILIGTIRIGNIGVYFKKKNDKKINNLLLHITIKGT